jgi:hypothetical protein
MAVTQAWVKTIVGHRYPLGALLLVRVGVVIGGGLVSLGWAMTESTPERGACTSPNFFGGDK